MRRTHTCGELRDSHVGQTVTLNGWVNTYRAYNDQVFIDLRDRYGLTQVVFEADRRRAVRRRQELRSEWVARRHGHGRATRLPGKAQPQARDRRRRGQGRRAARPQPLPDAAVRGHVDPQEAARRPELANEDLRLQYRYLDLRRPTLQRTLALRHRLNKVIRDYLDAQGFLELETPLLGRSTPEGAATTSCRAACTPASWYALPQSPQLYKQLLMVAGYDKYFQIARCLRDEDLRADRQPEFTQLDLEMSFVEMDDVFAVIEGLVAEVFQRVPRREIPTAVAAAEVRRRDAEVRQRQAGPALRPGDRRRQRPRRRRPSSRSSRTRSRPAARSAASTPRAARRSSRRKKPRRADRVRQARTAQGPGLGQGRGATSSPSPIEKFLPAPRRQRCANGSSAEPGDLLLFVADKEDVVCQALGAAAHAAWRPS